MKRSGQKQGERRGGREQKVSNFECFPEDLNEQHFSIGKPIESVCYKTATTFRVACVYFCQLYTLYIHFGYVFIQSS